MDLSKDEKALYAELAVQIAIRMGDVVFDRRPPQHPAPEDRFDIKGRDIEHGSVSDFEAGCRVLQRLKVAHPLDMDETPLEDDTAWAHWFRVDFDVPGLREHLRGALPAFAPPLSEVIVAFLALIVGYGYGMHSRRAVFAVPPTFGPTFDLFARYGYVERIGDNVKCADRIASELRAAHEWTEDLISHEEGEEALIDKMWRTMPARFRETFFSGGPVDIYALGDVIERFWYGGGWQDVGKTHEYPKIASNRAEALAKKFREAGG